jgi:hypothetical protein
MSVESLARVNDGDIDSIRQRMIEHPLFSRSAISNPCASSCRRTSLRSGISCRSPSDYNATSRVSKSLGCRRETATVHN